MLVVLCALVVSACADESERIVDPPPAEMRLVAVGRAERGGELRLRVVQNGDTLPIANVSLSAEPAPSAALDANDLATLLESGSVTFTAVVGDKSLSLVQNVLLPPRVAFEMVSGGNRDIYSVRLDGRDVERVTTNVAEDRWPTTAPGRLVYSSTRSGLTDLYALSSAGGAEDRLTTTTSLQEMEPAFSPDGSRIAFIGSEAGPVSVSKLYVASGTGTGAVRVTTNFGDAGSLESSPVWAPTNDRVAFVTTHQGSADIWVYFVNGDSIRPLVQHARADVEPAWSPDGKKLVFASNRDAPDAELYLLDIQTGSITRLTTRTGVDAQPSWLPDGRIVYTSYEGAVSSLRWLDPPAPTFTRLIPTSAAAVKPVALEWPSS